MEYNPNALNDDELWSKCKQGGSISPQDLGINTTSNPQETSQGITCITEGKVSHQFELNNKKK